jgi:hypothetical protein
MRVNESDKEICTGTLSWCTSRSSKFVTMVVPSWLKSFLYPTVEATRWREAGVH